MITQEDVAYKLLYGLWKAIDPTYKERYRADSWQHFENAIRTASYTDSLKKFLSNIQNRMPMTLLAKYGEDMMAIIRSGEDVQILEWLREETTYLVMVLRIQIQEEQKLFEEKNQ